MTKPLLPLAKPRTKRCSLLLAALLGAALPLPALAQPAQSGTELQLEMRRHADRELLAVYAAREYRPLWLTAAGTPGPAAQRLAELIATAAIDQVDPAALPAGELATALELVRSDPTPTARARAELALSRSFVDYVRAMRRAPAAAMTYEHEALRPALPDRDDALWAAASAPSLVDYVDGMQWMHPLYAQLRRAALDGGSGAAWTDPAIRSNLERIRALPPLGTGRSILVDTASARLWLYENGKPVDSMRVVVGKPDLQTPMLAGYVRHAIVNPYWNVPDDLIRGRIAPNVLSRGVGYLKTGGYQVLSGWDADAETIDPAKVDWRKVSKGEQELRVRQLPGAGNAMGTVKFEFPNPLGIYLHDTPDRDLMLKEARQFSSGCVRVEDAARLGRWLLEAPLPPSSGEPEQKVDVPGVVPVYITYLTASAEGGRLAIGPDPYKRDAPRTMFAGSDGATLPVSR